ncbi:MAG: DNRLRE domain-containing protein [Anaerolineaceae bacterium]
MSYITSDAVLQSAGLALTVDGDFSDNAGTLKAYRRLKPWTETGATWNSYDGTTAWTTAGGFDSADCESSEIGSTAFTSSETAGTLKEMTLSVSMVQAKRVSGTTTNNGILLKMETETDDMYGLASMNHATEEYRPMLSICTPCPPPERPKNPPQLRPRPKPHPHGNRNTHRNRHPH